MRNFLKWFNGPQRIYELYRRESSLDNLSSLLRNAVFNPFIKHPIIIISFY